MWMHHQQLDSALACSSPAETHNRVGPHTASDLLLYGPVTPETRFPLPSCLRKQFNWRPAQSKGHPSPYSGCADSQQIWIANKSPVDDVRASLTVNPGRVNRLWFNDCNLLGKRAGLNIVWAWSYFHENGPDDWRYLIECGPGSPICFLIYLQYNMNGLHFSWHLVI